MQYHETGLPQDAGVYKAFMMYSKNLALPRPRSFGEREAEGAAEMPLRLAQVMNEAGVKDPTALVFALLRQMPAQTYGLIEKSFGTDITAAIGEYAKHDKTKFAYIAEASDKVKLMSMATSIVTFEQFQREVDKTQEMINKLAEGSDDGKPKGELTIPFVPDMRIFDKLSDALYDKTTSPELETRFREKLREFHYTSERLKGMIVESGLASQLPQDMLRRFQQQDMPARTPSFADTELLDDPKVRAAYEIIAAHPKVSQDAFEAAVIVGQLLTKNQSGMNSTAVAAGLVLTGLRDVNKDDFEFLKKKLDWDVLELLQNYGGDKDLYPHELRVAPPEFRQFLLANSVATLERMKTNITQLNELINNQPDIPQEMRPVVLSQQLEQMSFMTERIEGMMDVLGRTGAPHLEDLFHKTMREVRTSISDNMPKTPRALPPPGFGFRKPPAKKPDGGGQNFDLD